MRAAPEQARVSESENARELRALIDRVLRAVERGELDATSSRGKALLRRLEGARVALEELAVPAARSTKATRPSHRAPTRQMTVKRRKQRKST